MFFFPYSYRSAANKKMMHIANLDILGFSFYLCPYFIISKLYCFAYRHSNYSHILLKLRARRLQPIVNPNQYLVIVWQKFSRQIKMICNICNNLHKSMFWSPRTLCLTIIPPTNWSIICANDFQSKYNHKSISFFL